MKHRIALLAAALAAATCGAASAGTVNLSFVNPAGYTDVGVYPDDKNENLAALARHIEAQAQQKLPAHQQLQLEVLDVDLAGKVRPSRRDSSGWVRVARAGLDWPAITVRYTLLANGQPIARGEERIQDMGFAGGMASYTSQPLIYEKRMLSRWMRDRFGAPAYAAAR